MKTKDTFQDILTITQVDNMQSYRSREECLQKEIRDVNTFLMILVKKGHADVWLDNRTHRITPDRFTLFIPNHLFRFDDVSADFQAYFLQIDKLFLEEVVHEKKGFYNYISLKKEPFTELEATENNSLEKAIGLLQEKMRERTHVFRKELVHNAAAGLLLETLGIMVKKTNDLIHPILSRKEEIVDQFLKLLAKYTRERYPLTFYAEKLFITPQYLSAILKEQTGKTGSKWIHEALIVEAKKLIRSPESTIQAVAYTLNFSDQSTFGKFFKKSIGISPLVYRMKESMVV